MFDTRNFQTDWRQDLWNEIHWTWPKSKLNNLYERAELYDMDPFEFFFSSNYKLPNEPYACSKECAMTKEEYLEHDKRSDDALHARQRAYKKKHMDKVWQLEKALERKQHDKMLSEICAYALTHGWQPSQLSDLLEPGEKLPWMYQPEQIDPTSIRLEPGQPALTFKKPREEDGRNGFSDLDSGSSRLLLAGKVSGHRLRPVEARTQRGEGALIRDM